MKTMADEPQRGKRKTPAQYKKLASLLSQEVPVGQALRMAGWSERQSKKGDAAVPDIVKAMIPKKAGRLVALGKTDKETLKHLAVGRLASNVIEGKDGGTMSAKVLGSHRDLNLWTPDQLTGVIVLQAPQYAIDHKAEMLADDTDEVILPNKPPTQIEG